MEVNRRAGFRAFKVAYAASLKKLFSYFTHFEVLVLFTVSLVHSENRHTRQAK